MNNLLKYFVLSLCLFPLHKVCANELAAATNADSFKQPAEIEADSLNYDKETSVVSAFGNVEIKQGGRTLTARKITYNQKSNLIDAEGDISLTEPNGNLFFADKVHLQDGFKKGTIENFSAKFLDNSRMTASRAERVNENILTMEQIFYSPCFICQEEPQKSPLWQVNAKKATLDENRQRIKYNHAFFKIKGVPVLYTPYLSHPTPNAGRKSGFLTPKYTTSKIFGTTIKTPYYYNISPNKDLTITPTFTGKEGELLSVEYRHLLSSGTYRIETSMTNPNEVSTTTGDALDGNELRGHIEGNGNFIINNKWTWGFNGKRSTDDTYLKKYNFGDEDVLISRVYSTAINKRNYIKSETISFQGLKANDDPGKTPLILPSATVHFESGSGFKGSRWTADGNLLVLSRDEGVSSNRLSLKGGWKIPHITKSGHIFELKTSLRGDGYFVDDVPENVLDINSRKLDGFTSRIIPQAEIKWAFPLIRKNVFLEPVFNFIISPHGGNPNKIHNEDSQDVEFSDENLFDSNHFTGFDRVENGPRMNYGIRAQISDTHESNISFLLGQNYHTKENKNFSSRSGLNHHFSDYVGRIGYQHNKGFNIAYRFRVDNESFSFNRNAVTAGVDLAAIKFNIDYLAVDENFEAIDNLDVENRELILASTSINITNSWTFSGNGHRNLESGEWISTKADLLYKGDCVDVSLAWFKEFTRDRDIRPNTTLSLQISLKNLGY